MDKALKERIEGAFLKSQQKRLACGEKHFVSPSQLSKDAPDYVKALREQIASLEEKRKILAMQEAWEAEAEYMRLYIESLGEKPLA